MLKASYRNHAHYNGIDIHFDDELLPVVIKSVINSLENASVVFLRISKSNLNIDEEDNSRVKQCKDI